MAAILPKIQRPDNMQISKTFLQTILLTMLLTLGVGASAAEEDKLAWTLAKDSLMSGEFMGAGSILYHHYANKFNRDDKTYSNYFSDFLFKQSASAVQLMSCIAMDTFALVEANFGQPGRDFRVEMEKIMAELNKLNPLNIIPDAGALDPQIYASLTPEQAEAYQQAQRYAAIRARELRGSGVTDCSTLNAEYNQLKHEMGKFFEPLQLSSGQQNQFYSDSTRTFYHSYLTDRYQWVTKQMPKPPRDSYRALD